MTVDHRDDPDGELLTVDELAAATGMTVRNTRYYAGLGLLPPPERRGRMVYYSARHRARLELVRALQDHGFTLAAIERYLARLPQDASVEDLAVHRVMVTSWHPAPHQVVTRREVEKRLGRPLDDELLTRLLAMNAVREQGDLFELLTGFDNLVRLLGLDLPLDALERANDAITRHMEALADELTEVLRSGVLAPFRERERTAADTARFEETMTSLRELTMESVVSGYQRAADEVIRRSLTR